MAAQASGGLAASQFFKRFTGVCVSSSSSACEGWREGAGRCEGVGWAEAPGLIGVIGTEPCATEGDGEGGVSGTEKQRERQRERDRKMEADAEASETKGRGSETERR